MFRRKKFLLGIIAITLFIFIQNSCFVESSIETRNDLKIRANYHLEEVAYIENTGGDTFKTIVENDLLIVMDMDGGLSFYKIEDPSNPSYLGGYDDSGLGHDMQKIGTKLYLANHQLGLQIFNISDPTSPVKLGSLTDSQSGETDSVYVKDNLA
ncbi:MAG: hypothetical protein FK734_19855 [Asgard group archaeon]|nr:hypothetical protein [Asgard group archaeon]